MIAFERILCAVDQSVYSQRTAQRALVLGEGLRAEVIVMSVRADVAPSVWEPRHAEPSTESGGSAAEQLFAFALRAGGGRPGKAIVANGSVVPEILRAAESEGADLLVVGLHGPPSGFKQLILSPVTERIVAKAERAVLAVARRPPEDITSAQLISQGIVCGIDRSSSSRRALQYAIALSQQAAAPLIVVHAFEDMATEDPRLALGHFSGPECWREVGPAIRASYEQVIREVVQQQEVHIDLRTPMGEAASGLLKVAEQSQADLIVLGSNGWYGGSGTTRQVLREAACDVLTVPALADTAGRPPA